MSQERSSYSPCATPVRVSICGCARARGRAGGLDIVEARCGIGLASKTRMAVTPHARPHSPFPPGESGSLPHTRPHAPTHLPTRVDVWHGRELRRAVVHIAIRMRRATEVCDLRIGVVCEALTYPQRVCTHEHISKDTMNTHHAKRLRHILGGFSSFSGNHLRSDLYVELS